MGRRKLTDGGEPTATHSELLPPSTLHPHTSFTVPSISTYIDRVDSDSLFYRHLYKVPCTSYHLVPGPTLCRIDLTPPPLSPYVSCFLFIVLLFKITCVECSQDLLSFLLSS